MRYFAAAAACAFSFAAMAQTEVNRYGTDVTSDMALIYAGGDQRPEWTVDEIAPYVTHTHADGRRSWLNPIYKPTNQPTNQPTKQTNKNQPSKNK